MAEKQCLLCNKSEETSEKMEKSRFAKHGHSVLLLGYLMLFVGFKNLPEDEVTCQREQLKSKQ